VSDTKPISLERPTRRLAHGFHRQFGGSEVAGAEQGLDAEFEVAFGHDLLDGAALDFSGQREDIVEGPELMLDELPRRA
jgi:hypothetical protein